MKTKTKLTRKQRAVLQSAAVKQAIPVAKLKPDDAVIGNLTSAVDTGIETISADNSIDLLALPTNALVAIRRSGGFMFRSDEVVAFADGHVTHRNSAFGSTAKASEVGTLTEAQLDSIKKALDPAHFTPFSASAAAVPDSYVVEIAAQVGNDIQRGEVAELFAIEPGRSIIRSLSMFILL